MAAAQQTSASAAVNEAAASVAKSMQNMTVAHIKHEELNNDIQAQVVRHALSAMESTQKDHALQCVMDLVTGALAQGSHQVSNGRSATRMGRSLIRHQALH